MRIRVRDRNNLVYDFSERLEVPVSILSGAVQDMVLILDLGLRYLPKPDCVDEHYCGLEVL